MAEVKLNRNGIRLVSPGSWQNYPLKEIALYLMCLWQESYDHLPSVRKLDADDRKMAEQMLAMKVDKKVVQNHLIQKTQKQVLLYDLHNIAAAYNKSKGDCDSLPKEMKKKGNILPKEMKKEGNGLPKEMKKDVGRFIIYISWVVKECCPIEK